jgi:hypothetical protein
MKLKSRLFALAVMCVGTPAALVAQPQDSANDIVGTWSIVALMPNVGEISIVSICTADHKLMNIVQQPSQRGSRGKTSLNVMFGSWDKAAPGKFRLTFKKDTSDGSELVNGVANVSELGRVVTGNASVEFRDAAGKLLSSGEATVRGNKLDEARSLTANQ